MKTFAFALILAGLACTAHAHVVGADKATIQALETKIAEAANRQDAKGAAAFYAEDATLIGSDGKRFDGRAAIEAWWAGATQGLKDAKLTTVDVVAVGPDLAIEDGTFTATTRGDKPQKIGGVYNMLWRKTATSWEVVTDIAH